MRASRFLRQRAQLNRSRYAVRVIATDVLPTLVSAMQTMNDTLRVQGNMIRRAATQEGENR